MPWEHGSELTLPPGLPVGAPHSAPWEAGQLYGSGRDALRAVLRHGQATRGWKRLRVPSYFCQEVVAAAANELPVSPYFDQPTLAEPDGRRIREDAGDVVLVANTFGLRSARWQLECANADTIEDHTHDPWSDWARHSVAGYAIASLRKTLPMPEGGALWSPRGLPLPAEPKVTSEREQAAEKKLTAQVLKSLYLAGHAIEKSVFLKLAADAEPGISSGEISAMTPASAELLRILPAEAWRTRRRDNFEHAARLLVAPLRAAGVALLQPAPGAVSFSLALRFPSAAARSAARSALVERSVYPALLWSLDEATVEVTESDLQLSTELLSIHCDYRYDSLHMTQLATHIASALNS